MGTKYFQDLLLCSRNLVEPTASGACSKHAGGGRLLADVPLWGNAFMHYGSQCGTQPIPDCWVVGWLIGGWLAIPTKTLLADSQFSGRQYSLQIVPLHVLRTRLFGSALFWYFDLFVRMWSHPSLSFRVAIMWFLTSCGSRVLKSLYLPSTQPVHLLYHLHLSHQLKFTGHSLFRQLGVSSLLHCHITCLYILIYIC